MGRMKEKYPATSEMVKNAYIRARMVHGDVLNHQIGEYVITKDIATEMSEHLDYIEDMFLLCLFPLFEIDKDEADNEFEKICLGE